MCEQAGGEVGWGQTQYLTNPLLFSIEKECVKGTSNTSNASINSDPLVILLYCLNPIGFLPGVSGGTMSLRIAVKIALISPSCFSILFSSSVNL